MSAPARTTAAEPTIRHQEWCPDNPRIESFPYLADDPHGGRSRATHVITRCIECGEETYKQIGD